MVLIFICILLKQFTQLSSQKQPVNEPVNEPVAAGFQSGTEKS